MPDYRLREGVKVREEDFGGLAFMLATSEIMQLNRPGYQLLCQISASGQAGSSLPDIDHQPFLQVLIERGVIEGVRQ